MALGKPSRVVKTHGRVCVHMTLESFDKFCPRNIHIAGCECDSHLPRDLRVFQWLRQGDPEREREGDEITYIWPHGT